MEYVSINVRLPIEGRLLKVKLMVSGTEKECFRCTSADTGYNWADSITAIGMSIQVSHWKYIDDKN